MQFWKIKALTYLNGAWPYRWYALGVTWLICLFGWGMVAVMPDQYRVEAKVYIDTDSLMGPLLKGLTVTTDPGQQVEVMLKTLITRPNLEQVVHLTTPKADKIKPAEMENLVQALQSNITIRSLGTKNYYAIGYSNNNSDYAQSVTQALLSILVDSNIGDKRKDMEGARSFIDKKATEYEDMLRDAEKRRADFKIANPDLIGKGGASARLDTASQAVVTAQQDLSLAQARRDSLRAQLAATPKTVSFSDNAITGIGGAQTSAGGTLLQKLQAARQSLDDLRLKFTDDHPDVIAAKKNIQKLQADIATGPKQTPADEQVPGAPNPVYVDLRSKLADQEMNYAMQRQRVSSAVAELNAAKKVTSRTIEVQARYADLDRDYGNIEKTYQELLKSRESARLSQAMDDQNQSIAFRVVEPPEKSAVPAAPNRPLLNSAVLFAGIGAGGALAIFLSLTAGRFVTSDELTAQFGVPLIGVVTRLRQAADSHRNRMAAYALSGSAILLLFCYLGVLAVLRTSIYSVLGA